MFDVYLCVSESNYCHIIFDTMMQAQLWCERHSGYHVIVRTVYLTQPVEEFHLCVHNNPVGSCSWCDLRDAGGLFPELKNNG